MSSYHDAVTRLTSPDRTFSPAPIWWWSGEPLDSARLRWQLERFAAGGVYNLVILNLAPSGPLHGSLADDPPFLSQAWWDIFVGVCRDARELGIRLWFYDQIGFSGANLQGLLIRQNAQFAGQVLGQKEITCTQPADLVFPDGSMPLAAWVCRPDGAVQRIPIVNGQVSTQERGAHIVRLIYAIVKGFDYLSATACMALRDTVHEAFLREAGAYFGDVIVGSFQDELPSMPTWSHDFAASFQAHYGYDLLDELIALYHGEDARSQQVRIDYQEWRAMRAEQAFFRPFYDWHALHGLICGFDQQSPARMALAVGAVDEYADYQQTHRWYGAPGSDHHGNGKIHSSLAHLYGHPRSWIEAFHSSGWGGTLEETFDWLVPWLRAGLTLYNPHAVYYSTKGGWWEWAPPSTCWRQPYWRHYRHFADAIMRLTGVLSTGSHVCDIAVLFPTTTVQAHLLATGPLAASTRAEQCFVELTGSMFWNNPQPGLFDRIRRDYDMLDNDSLARAAVYDGGLHIANEVYRVLILPAVTHLTPGCIAAINRFVRDGGVVYALECMPHGVDAHANIAYVADMVELAQRLESLPRRVEGEVHVLERRVDGGSVVLVTPTVSGSQFHWNGHWNSTPYDFEAQRIPTSLRISIPGAQSVEQWFVGNGERRVLTPTAAHTWDVSLDDAPIALIFVPDVALTPAPPLPESNPDVSTLAGVWRVAIEPTVDNQWGDLAYPAGGLLLPQTRRFTDAAGDVHLQGFGVYAWSYGPTLPAALPHPLPEIQPGADPLAVAGWQPVVYSLERGIQHDTLHWGMLGPKGYVPEEFLHFGVVPQGQAVRVRTTVTIDHAFVGDFVIAAAAAKRVWLDGVAYTDCAPGYQWFIAVDWRAGMHLIEFEFAPEQTVNLRGYWALVQHAERFRRPNWIMQVDAPQPATTLTFQRVFHLSQAATHARMMVIADVPVRVLLDGNEIGRQGGYDPYGSTVRVQPYQIGALTEGAHTLLIEALDGGRGVSLLVDAICTHVDAEPTLVMTGNDWYVHRGDAAQMPAHIRRRQWVDLTFDTDHALYVDMDPGWPLIWRRPHPLPQAHWLEAAPADGTVRMCVPDAYAGHLRQSTLQWRIPVGATAMRIQSRAGVRVMVDDVTYPCHAGLVVLPADAQRATVVLDATEGGAGAALLTAPVSYTWSQGTATLPASFAALGLGDYAGAVIFEHDMMWQASGGRTLLTCTHVRGSVDVSVNGIAVGVRLWSPYQFDITDALQQGTNTIRITVTGTLAAYLAGHSPTHYAPAHQEVAGILGDVKIMHMAN